MESWGTAPSLEDGNRGTNSAFETKKGIQTAVDDDALLAK
jgi:hypothetical protein